VTTWILVWFVVALLTTVALAACVIALGRHVLIIGRTAKRFQEEAQPIADEVSRQARRASEHAGSLRPPRGRP
jgi:hypothetical protein